MNPISRGLWLGPVFACLGLACGSSPGNGGDAGVDAGVDAGTGACSLNNYQPDVCGYGGACNSAGSCQAAANDTCGNITSAISKGNFTAWTTNSTGPIIYFVQDEADDASKCQAGTTPFTLTVYAYAGTTVFSDNKSNLPGFWYFDSSGNKTDIAAILLQSANYKVENSGYNMSAKFTLCAASGLTQIVAGFAFTGGNAYCETLVH